METDYPETITVSVTKEHIDAGEYWDAERCPVALSLRDKLRELSVPFTEVAVYGEAVIITVGTGSSRWVGGATITSTRYDASTAKEWQRNYDHHEPVEPATFTFTRMQP